MFGDWIIDLIECGAITCAKKTINRGKVVASFCMGSQTLYDYIDNNPFFEFHPTEYVNDPFVIAQHDKMVAINVGPGDRPDRPGLRRLARLPVLQRDRRAGGLHPRRGPQPRRQGDHRHALDGQGRRRSRRIVPHLTEGAGVVTTRGDVHYVVTEYGIAYLHGKSIRERVLSLINIAHPKFRKELIQAAKAQKYIYQDQIELAWEQVATRRNWSTTQTLQRRHGDLLPAGQADRRAGAVGDAVLAQRPTSVRTPLLHPHHDLPAQGRAEADQHRLRAEPGDRRRGARASAGEEIVAIAQYFLDPKTQAAEVAFIVQDEWQDKGMGTFLLEYLTPDRQAARRQEVLRQGAADQQGDADGLLQLRLQGQHRIRRRRLQHQLSAGLNANLGQPEGRSDPFALASLAGRRFMWGFFVLCGRLRRVRIDGPSFRFGRPGRMCADRAGLLRYGGPCKDGADAF